MHYHPVAVAVAPPQGLDTLSAIGFLAAFALAAVLAARRPAYALVFLLVSVPFAFYRETLGTTVTLSKVVLLGVLLGLTTYRGVLAYLRERPARWILIAAILVLAATALSMTQAGVLAPAVRETLKALQYVLVFCAAFLCYRLDPDETAIRWGVGVVTTVVALAALAQEILGAPSGLYPGSTIVPRIAGPLEGPNQLAGYLEVTIAMLAAFCCTRPTRGISFALALAVFVDFLTFSRAGLVGAAIALLVVVICYRAAARRLIAPLASGVVLGALGVGFWALQAHTLALFVGRGLAKDYAGGVGSRSVLWRAAWTLWKQHPLLGVGAGNFELDLPQAGVYGIRTHANSLYLQALVEGGIPLFATAVFELAVVIAAFVRRASASPFVAAALAATIALAAHQVLDCLFFYPKIGAWWWIAVALGAAELTRSRA